MTVRLRDIDSPVETCQTQEPRDNVLLAVASWSSGLTDWWDDSELHWTTQGPFGWDWPPLLTTLSPILSQGLSPSLRPGVLHPDCGYGRGLHHRHHLQVGALNFV